MNPRSFPAALLALTFAAACGGPSSPEAGRFGIELLLSQALVDELAAFQIIVLPDGRQRDCAKIQETCLRTQVKQDVPLVLHDGNGTEGRALRFSANLSNGQTQDVSIEVPVGRDYVLVIEAISGSTPPSFLGSSCNYLPEVNASQNAPVLAAPMTLNPVACDPTL